MYNLFISPLKAYPGPLLWRTTRAPYLWSQLRGTLPHDVGKLHQRYGPVVRITPTGISYTSAAVWEDVFAHRKHGQPEFEKALSQVTVNGVPSILGANREDHSRFRRLLSHAFSAQGMREQEPKITEYVDKMINGLADHCKDGPQNMVSWFNWTTFDLIGDLAFGESFGCLDNAHTHPWIQDVFRNIASLPFMMAVRDWGLMPLAKFLVPKDLRESRLRNYQYVSDLIDKRVTFGTDRGDFFDNVLKQDAEKGKCQLLTLHVAGERSGSSSLSTGMTHEELKSSASSIVLAGSETTATLLSGLVFHLLNNPQVYDKAMQEVRTSFSSPDDINITSTLQLHYLQAVLTETMRLYPPVPASTDRRVPPGGAMVDGRFMPGGTVVHYFHDVLYQLPSHFEKPDEMHPERWFPEGERPKEFDNDNRAVHQPFSYGPRNCIGKNLAYSEMRLISAKLLFRFDLSKPAEGTRARQEFDTWKETQLVKILWEKPPLWVDVTERDWRST